MQEDLFYNFGEVIVGETKVHKIVVCNNTTVIQSYIIVFDENQAMQFGCNCFLIKPLKITGIETNKEEFFKLTFCPLVPGKRSRYNFRICRSDGFTINVNLKGICVGPTVEPTTDLITFNCCKRDEIQHKYFHLVNEGKSKALFMFDASTLSQLTVQPLHGCIQPSSKTRIVIRFKAKCDKAYYFRTLICCVLHCDPVKLSVINIPERDKGAIDLGSILLASENVQQNIEVRRCSMSNESLHSSALISINETVVNFQSGLPGERFKKLLSVTNNANYDTTLMWDTDETGPFELTSKVVIKSLSTEDIQVSFCPEKKDQFYFTTFYASIICADHLMLQNLTFSVLGHSFESCDCFWSAQFNIEPETLNISANCSVVNLPSPGPNSTTRTTFLIRRYGHLPLSFRFHRPLHTHFTVTPMQGLIIGPFQIILIAMEVGEITKNSFYKEKWLIEFNFGSIKHELFLQSHIDRPILIVNGSAQVQFPKTHPNCSQPYQVTVKNPTHNMIKFQMKVVSGTDVLKTETSAHKVESNETIRITWVFTPPAPGKYSGEVYFSFCEQLFSDFNFVVLFSGECEIGFLETVPQFFSMGSITLGSWENEIFNLVNRSECSLFISLDCNPCTLMSQKGEVYLHPERLTVKAGDSVQIEVCATPGGLYHHDLQIGCQFRKAEESDEFIKDSWIPLIRFDLIGIYPIFKVIDIKVQTLNYLSKYDVWKLLDINRLNDLLKTMYFGNEPRSTELYLPALVENSSYQISLMIKNESNVNAYWTIIRRKTCKCSLEREQFGINIFKMVSTCEHKRQIVLDPKSGSLSGEEVVYLVLDVKYNLIGEERQTFCLKINPDKMPWLGSQLTITFVRYAIPAGVAMLWPAMLHTYDTLEVDFKMIPIFIGQRRPFLQAFWFYNSTALPTPYLVKAKWIQNCAFTCINPEGIVQPFSSSPLLFRFIPNELNVYEALFCLVVNGKELDIRIECDSACVFPRMSFYETLNKMPSMPLLQVLPTVELNIDHIILPLVPLHSTADHIFYLNNYTSSKIYFKWRRVIPDRQMVEPYQCVLLKVKCKTAGQPLLLSCNLICHIRLLPEVPFRGSSVVCSDDQSKKLTTKQTTGITVTVHANETNHLILKNSLKYRPGAEIIPKVRTKEFTEHRKLSSGNAEVIVNIFDRVLCEIVSSSYLEHNLKRFPPIYYKEFLQKDVHSKAQSVVLRRQIVETEYEGLHVDSLTSARVCEDNEEEYGGCENNGIEDEHFDFSDGGYVDNDAVFKVRCPLDLKQQIFGCVVGELVSEYYISRLFQSRL